jgi:hypothetical protein
MRRRAPDCVTASRTGSHRGTRCAHGARPGPLASESLGPRSFCRADPGNNLAAGRPDLTNAPPDSGRYEPKQDPVPILVTGLYSLRFALAAPETARGLRRAVLDAAPLPGLQAPEEPQAIDPPPAKKAALLALYRAHPDYGNRAAASKVAADLAPQAGLTTGTARAYLYAELESRAS